MRHFYWVGLLGVWTLTYSLGRLLSMRAPLFVSYEGWGLLDWPGHLAYALLRHAGLGGAISSGSGPFPGFVAITSFVVFAGVAFLVVSTIFAVVHLGSDERAVWLKRAVPLSLVYLAIATLLRTLSFLLTGIGDWGIGSDVVTTGISVRFMTLFLSHRWWVGVIEAVTVSAHTVAGRSVPFVVLAGFAIPLILELALARSTLPTWFQQQGVLSAWPFVIPATIAGVLSAWIGISWRSGMKESYI